MFLQHRLYSSTTKTFICRDRTDIDAFQPCLKPSPYGSPRDIVIQIPSEPNRSQETARGETLGAFPLLLLETEITGGQQCPSGLVPSTRAMPIPHQPLPGVVWSTVVILEKSMKLALLSSFYQRRKQSS